MTMRGTPFVYYGDELALRPGSQIIVDDRDAQRTPMSWSAVGAGHGFSTGAPWIAFGEAPELTAVDVEDADPGSMLTYYRQLLAFRRGHAVWGVGDTRLVALDVSAVVAFVRQDATEAYLVAVNLSDEDQEGVATDPLPTGGPVVFGDGALDVNGGAVHVKLAARGAAIFKVR
jgi:glycosidase